MAVCLALFPAGCAQQSRPITAADTPDGHVEVLRLSDGKVRHEHQTFHETVLRKDDVLVLVDFWASWCAPCLMMNPEMERVKQEWRDKVEIVKVNVDENPALQEYFGASGLPTVLIVRSGKLITGFQGSHSSSAISRILKDLQ